MKLSIVKQPVADTCPTRLERINPILPDAFRKVVCLRRKKIMSKLKFIVPVFAVLFLSAFSASVNAQTPVLTPQDNGPCTDKWINYAYRTELRRAPVGRAGGGECNIYLYKAGRWNNYSELKSGVIAWNGIRQRSGIDVRTVNAVYKLFRQNRALEATLKAVSGPISKVVDLMGNVLSQFNTGQRSLLDVGTERIDIGNGSTVLIK
jgi:hypothetical protein